MNQGFRRTRFACFYTYLATASVFVLPPLLFVTFRETYGISYTLLGTLVLVNFFTQLLVDLLFSFFPKLFDIKRTLRITPLLTTLGLLLYALVPWLAPRHAYAGLLAGTVIFSVSAGLCEVLLSPTVAALPSDNPERDMSMLHSLYGYGVVSVVVVSTLFLQLLGRENWMYLTLLWAALPVGSFVLFCTSPIPEFNLSHGDASGKTKHRGTIMALCVVCIFLGSASENTMTSWISTFMENSLHIPKATGDMVGMAVFALLLALTRTWYAKYGKRITRMLMVGMAGAVCCYVTVGLSGSAAVSLVACALTGIFTSMLWPGTLILMEEKLPAPGMTAYALMAAGGDLGGSVAPQLMGAVVDGISSTPWAAQTGAALAMTAEQLAMKCGMLITALFPLAGICLLLYMRRYFVRHKG